ncbi:MAG: 30S ribosomal protein S20 [Bacilli bacterium]
MANIKQQKKRTITNNKKNKLNTSFSSSLKTAIKNVEIAVEEKNAPEAKAALLIAESKLDKAVGKGFLHKNNASRHKARLTKLVNSVLK